MSLTTGQRVDGPLGKVGTVGQFERLRNGDLVFRGPLLVPGLVGVTTSRDQVDDRQTLWRNGVLGQQPEDLGHLFGAQRRDVAAVEQHLPRGRLEQTYQRAQQRGFTAPVGADDGGDLAVGDRDVEIVDDGSVAVADLEAGGRDASRGLFRVQGTHTEAFRLIWTMR